MESRYYVRTTMLQPHGTTVLGTHNNATASWDYGTTYAQQCYSLMGLLRTHMQCIHLLLVPGSTHHGGQGCLAQRHTCISVPASCPVPRALCPVPDTGCDNQPINQSMNE